MRQNHFYLIFLIGFLASISSYLLSRSISGPITQLSIEANKIKDLDFGESPVIHTKIQEIKELSNAITALKTSVQSFSYYS
jgi:adenylate cyclase